MGVVVIDAAGGTNSTKTKKMKRSETTKEKWEDAVFAAESKEISEWVDSLREMGCNDIRIISRDNYGLCTTIISDSSCGDAYVITRNLVVDELSESVICFLFSDEVTKTISDIYISSETK